MFRTAARRRAAQSALFLFALIIGAACSADCEGEAQARDDAQVSAWHWNVFNRNTPKTVTPGPAVTTTPAGVLATPPPANQRYATAEPITAVFTPAAFTTTYTLKMAGTFPEGGRVRWTGANCGTTTGDDRVIAPGDATRPFDVTSVFVWTHPHPPCGETPDHLDATITATLVEGGTTPNTTRYTTTCTYRGAATGSGVTCELRR